SSLFNQKHDKAVDGDEVENDD
ncbi:unnamed protein product, partial [Rotaria sp. Silwood2]